MQKIKLSSANNMREIEGQLGAVETPLNKLIFSLSTIIYDKPRAHKTNNYGERGPPCLIPLLGNKDPSISPFSKKEQKTKEIHLIIRSSNLTSKPNLIIMPLRKDHSTRSYALLISSFKATYPVLPPLCCLIQCIASKPSKTLSVINLLGPKHFEDHQSLHPKPI